MWRVHREQEEQSEGGRKERRRGGRKRLRTNVFVLMDRCAAPPGGCKEVSTHTLPRFHYKLYIKAPHHYTDGANTWYPVSPLMRINESLNEKVMKYWICDVSSPQPQLLACVCVCVCLKFKECVLSDSSLQSSLWVSLIRRVCLIGSASKEMDLLLCDGKAAASTCVKNIWMYW